LAGRRPLVFRADLKTCANRDTHQQRKACEPSERREASIELFVHILKIALEKYRCKKIRPDTLGFYIFMETQAAFVIPYRAIIAIISSYYERFLIE
ncbi:MAG TPA: hypothetical protein VFD30_17985, partial [Terriglobia bacterium]|nr:hypothetical protein [Terriglobia bacterium]